jgi:hypothetical protein
MKQLGPSALDAEIRMLPSSSFSNFLAALDSAIKTKNDFELLQAYLLAFIRIHGDSLKGLKELQIFESIRELWESLESDFMYTLCMIDYSRRTQIS